MCTIYQRIKKDFSFVENYGFSFAYPLKHYVHPSVLYKRGKEALDIGFDYETGKFCAYYSDDYMKYNSFDFLADDKYDNRSYKKQLPLVKEKIDVFLKGLNKK